MTVVDSLPTDLYYVSHEFKIPTGGLQTGGGVNDNVITWEGVLAAGGSVEIVIVAVSAQKAAVGTEFVNTAVITAGEKTAEAGGTITV